MMQDYYEFLESHFLQPEDEYGALDHDENDQLMLFYTMYTSLSDDADGFRDVLDSLCNTDDAFKSCTDDSDRLERRDEIRYDVLSHLTAGLERCGEDRSEMLQGTNFGTIDGILSEHYAAIDEVGEGVDPDEVDIESMIDEIRKWVGTLASSLASSSWFSEWATNKYAIDVFAECLRQLRALQERDLAELKDRAEREVSNLRAHFEQKTAAHHSVHVDTVENNHEATNDDGAPVGAAGTGAEPGDVAPDATSIDEQLNRARRELLDLTLRNSLLNFRSSKARGLKIVNESPREIFKILVVERRAMSFRATRTQADEGASTDDGQALPAELSSLIETRDDPEQPAAHHVDALLQTPYDKPHLDVRLRNTHRLAHTSIEEQGVNILYLALGMLHWFESDSSDERRSAPLILIPSALDRTDARARFTLRFAEEEIDTNLSLNEKLRQDFDILLPDLPDPEDVEVDEYFRQVEKAVAPQNRWSIDAGAVELGFFSFNKLLIYKDLDPTSWPEDHAPSDHPLIQALFGTQGFQDPASPIGDDDHLDDHLDGSDIHHVVDSDSSQTLAVVDVKNGRNLVIQGPPGTGKSQTITNLIADAIADDKKVLFVAEKTAALEVVKRRLDEIHIGDACLELHSHKANKRAVLDELERTLDLGKPVVSGQAGDYALLARDRTRLNEYARAVNAGVGCSRLSPHDIFGRLAQLHVLGATEWPALAIPDATSWSQADFVEHRDRIDALRMLVETIGPVHEHHFWLSGRQSPLPMDREQVARALSTAAEAVNRVRTAGDDVGRVLHVGISPDDREALEALVRSLRRAADAPNLARVDHRKPEWAARSDVFGAAAHAMLEVASRLEEYETLLRPDAWHADVQPHREAIQRWGARWWRFVSGSYRAASSGLRDLCDKDLPRDGTTQLAIIDTILEARRLRETVDKSGLLSQFSSNVLPNGGAGDWRSLGETASWVLEFHADKVAGAFVDDVHEILDRDLDRAELRRHAQQCEAALEALSSALCLVAERLEARPERYSAGISLGDRPFSDLDAWLDRASEDLDSLDDVIRFNTHEAHLNAHQLGPVAEIASQWSQAGAHLTRLVEYAWLSSLIAPVLREEPLLAQFDRDTHQGLIDRFRRLDFGLFQHNRELVALSHWRRLPRESGGGQLGVLRREFEKRRRHLPLRKLMAQAGSAVQQIKPVFMMSPLSIAKFIPPDSVRFDLVIFDEASQVRPVDALGAIIRAEQAVVVGDSKQLPPTRFFDRLGEDDPGDAESTTAADLESILGMFRAAGAPERMLRWHYRSHHESLIAVSNHEFYDNRLVLFPSPDAERTQTGLHFRLHPSTCYERGERKRYNAGEARAVADAVMEHARTTPNLTLGVAAFGMSQARRIEDEVEIRRRMDSSTESFFADHPQEPFFVKNLENVQGDERDVVFISVGYGRIEGGYMPMTFGPLNQDGGERRLNVLITRARRRLEVHANFTADDLDTERTDARGIEVLKTFLRYAETGILDVPKASGEEAGSPFEEAVAESLSKLGHTVRHQIGSAGFFVDLGVVDPLRPGRYLLGIECDGATYHSARSARDRDRLRQDVLEARSWTIHRIWSTDWFRNPRRELERVDGAIKRAAQAQTAVVPPKAPPEPPLERADVGEATPLQGNRGSQPYRVASLNVQMHLLGLDNVDDGTVIRWILEVVRVESPVHVEETAFRIANAVGHQRTGKRIRARVRRTAQRLSKGGRLRMAGGFLWRVDHAEMEFPHTRHSSGRSKVQTQPFVGATTYLAGCEGQT